MASTVISFRMKALGSARTPAQGEQLLVSLPAAERRFVDEQVSGGGYATAGEYVRQLVRADQKRQAKAELEQTLLDAIQSGDPLALTVEKVEAARQRLRSKLASRAGGRRDEMPG